MTASAGRARSGCPCPGSSCAWPAGTRARSCCGARTCSPAEAFDPGGWFRTGDLGSFDERGYLRIEGRSKELIITGGYNVHPREVEERLLEHPGVAEAAVVGTPSEEWGEQVTAFVVPADPAAPPAREELLAFAAERLAGFKRPRVLHYVEALPRNALGKVLKHELRG
jgi:malonyl-CoA/methylmalonyl-CoA synthetase